MQAVILAAGQGTRLRPITLRVPKPLIRIGNKNLMEYNLERLPGEINELIIVVGYLGDKIINHFGNKKGGRKIIYIKQKKLSGTGGALHLCKDILRDRFLVMMGDDIYGVQDIRKCLKHRQCILTKEVKDKFTGGRIIRDSKGNLKAIIEGRHHKKENLVNTGLYVLTKNFFQYNLVPLKKEGEFGLPQTLVKVSKDYPLKIEKAGFWLQINNIDDLNQAKRILKIK